MTALRPPLRAILFGALVLLAAAAGPARPHHPNRDASDIPAAPAPGTPVESLTGSIGVLQIDDRVSGAVTRYVALAVSSDSSLLMIGSSLEGLERGMRVDATGRRNGGALFVDAWRALSGPSTGPDPGTTRFTAEGTLGLLHEDDFDNGTGQFVVVIDSDEGRHTRLVLPGRPAVLERGMRVTATGDLRSDGVTLRPDTITILAAPPTKASRDVEAKAVYVKNVLVIHLKYRDSMGNPVADPFPTSNAQTTVFAATGSVAKYYEEVSYGQHTLTGIVTPWLVGPGLPPASCDYIQIETDARNAATAAGYVLNNYQNKVYVFSGVSSCGWAGLAYVGSPGTTNGRAWIKGNQGVLVHAHELGHNFGSLHAASIDCGTQILGGSCTVSEYGDRFNTMGNVRAMHMAAMQKDDLGWFAASMVKTHSAGSAVYTLNPLESPGGTIYAVKIPAAANRTYWLEYRQPIGFDAALASLPNNGVQVRVAYPFEWACSGCGNDTQLLDMTPATSSFDDSALVVGQSYVDSVYGIGISVTAATPTALTVSVLTLGEVPKADLDFSSTTDLVWRNSASGNAAAWLMNGTGPTSGGVISSSATLTPTHAGDFNGDGKGDLLWRNTATGQTSIWLMNGLAASSSATLAMTTDQQVTHVGDFNGDGRTDLVVRNTTTGHTSIWLMSGTTALSSPTIVTDANWAVVLIGDFNADGRTDLVWRKASTGETAIWLMNGTTASSSAVILASTAWLPIATGDFNGDVRADLVWRNTSTGQTAVWLMNGTAASSSAIVFSDPNWQVTHAADLNGDGKADLVWRNAATGQTAAWLMNGLASTAATVLFSDPAWTMDFTGDLNGDGRHDLVWHRTTGQTAVWLMNGLASTSAATILNDAAWSVVPLKRH